MNIRGINASATPEVPAHQDPWDQEARETPSAKHREKLEGETVTRQMQPKTTQALQAAGKARADKIATEEKMRDTLRLFSKEISYLWGAEE